MLRSTGEKSSDGPLSEKMISNYFKLRWEFIFNFHAWKWLEVKHISRMKEKIDNIERLEGAHNAAFPKPEQIAGIMQFEG